MLNHTLNHIQFVNQMLDQNQISSKDLSDLYNFETNLFQKSLLINILDRDEKELKNFFDQLKISKIKNKKGIQSVLQKIKMHLSSIDQLNELIAKINFEKNNLNQNLCELYHLMHYYYNAHKKIKNFYVFLQKIKPLFDNIQNQSYEADLTKIIDTRKYALETSLETIYQNNQNIFNQKPKYKFIIDMESKLAPLKEILYEEENINNRNKDIEEEQDLNEKKECFKHMKKNMNNIRQIISIYDKIDIQNDMFNLNFIDNVNQNFSLTKYVDEKINPIVEARQQELYGIGFNPVSNNPVSNNPVNNPVSNNANKFSVLKVIFYLCIFLFVLFLLYFGIKINLKYKKIVNIQKSTSVVYK